jgi:tetratricopeptide (TPR) repeat protein
MRPRSPYLLLSSLIVSFLAVGGCGGAVVDDGEGGGNTPCDQPCYVAHGWDSYEAGLWDDINLFRIAVSMDSTDGEAWMGLAWFDIEKGFVGTAQEEFQRAIELDPSLVAAYAGNAYALAAQQNLGDAVVMAEVALEKGGDEYVFEHNPDVSANSLRVLLASIYFRVGDYGLAQFQVDIVAPGNGLNDASPTYVQDLMLVISSLGGLI